MKLFLVRHGETDWNVEKKIQGKTDIPLNKNGLRQARELAQKLICDNITAGIVYTSPQKRALATAQAVAEALQVKYLIKDGLREMDFAEWEGYNWETVRRKYGETYQYWNTHRRYAHTPGGESYNEVLKRSLEALGEIASEGKQNAVVVTHSAVLMALGCYLNGADFEEDTMIGRFKLQNARAVEIDALDVEAAVKRFWIEEGNL